MLISCIFYVGLIVYLNILSDYKGFQKSSLRITPREIDHYSIALQIGDGRRFLTPYTVYNCDNGSFFFLLLYGPNL